MRKNNGSSIALIIGSFSAIAFFAMYFILSFYNRLGADDLLEVKWNFQYGWLSSVKSSWMFGDGSIINSMGHQTVIPVLFGLNKVYLFNYITILLLTGSFFFAIIALIQDLGISVSRVWVVVLSSLLVSLFYFVSPDTTQCCYWVSSMILYVWPIISFVIAVTFFLKSGNNINLFFLYVFVFAFSLSRIHFTLGLSICLFFYLAYRSYLYKKVEKKLLLVLIINVIGVAFVITAPGNYFRRAIELNDKFIDYSFLHALGTSLKEVCDNLMPRLKYYTCGFIIFLWVGSIAENYSAGANKIDELLDFGLIRILLIVIVLIVVLFVFNAAFFYVAVMKCYYAGRVWTHVYFFILLSVVFFAFLVGYRLKYLTKYFFVMFSIAVVFLTYCELNCIYEFFPVNRAYAEQYDVNIELIKQAQKEHRTAVLYLHPMANTGLIQPWLVEKDTSGWVNISLEYIYRLHCPLSDSTVIMRDPK